MSSTIALASPAAALLGTPGKKLSILELPRLLLVLSMYLSLQVIQTLDHRLALFTSAAACTASALQPHAKCLPPAAVVSCQVAASVWPQVPLQYSSSCCSRSMLDMSNMNWLPPMPLLLSHQLQLPYILLVLLFAFHLLLVLLCG